MSFLWTRNMLIINSKLRYIKVFFVLHFKNVFLKINFFFQINIFYVFSYHFDVLILKITKFYFNAFRSEKYFKKQ
jgi:hypothetical protein